MIYLACKSEKHKQFPNKYGLMCNVKRIVGGQWEVLDMGCPWMLDNGAFTGFDESRFFQQLGKYVKYSGTCIGVVVPDKPFNWPLTLEMFQRYHEPIRANGFPVALATQNGADPKHIPWSDVDVLFIGGDHEHKRSEAHWLAWHAKKHGKWVHVGRVQSGRRIMQHFQWADSADGTTHKHHPTQQDPGIIAAINARKHFQWALPVKGINPYMGVKQNAAD